MPYIPVYLELQKLYNIERVQHHWVQRMMDSHHTFEVYVEVEAVEVEC